MTKEAIIKKTVSVIRLLPEEMAIEIYNFADFLAKNYEDKLINNNIKKLVNNSTTFSFLNEDDGIYSIADLKEIYND